MTNANRPDKADWKKFDMRSEFPSRALPNPPAAFGEFVEEMRQLQDLAVSIDAPNEVYEAARDQAAALVELLNPYEAREGQGPANRSITLPGRGSLLNPPWYIKSFGSDGVVQHGTLRRYHLGGGGYAHGGVLPLLFDDNFGMVVFAAGRAASRTAYLNVNYRKVTPLNTPLLLSGRVDSTSGRKAFVSAEITDEDGTVLAEAEGLMVELLEGQP